MKDINLRLRGIAAMTDPKSDIGIAINLLISDVERDQKKRASQCERTRRCAAKKREANVSLTVSLTPHQNTSKREPNGEANVSLTSSIIREEHNSTIHLSNISKKDDLNLITGKRKKATSSLPVDWELPASYAKLASSLGMEPETVAIEAANFKSNHLAKGTKNANWYYAWQGWCLKWVQRNKKYQSAKPLTPYQQNQADRKKVLDELAKFAYGDDAACQAKPKNGSPLGPSNDPTLPFGRLYGA